MLKIKDNVDLKELEKFGFYRKNNYYEYYYHIGAFTDYVQFRINISEQNRVLNTYSYGYSDKNTYATVNLSVLTKMIYILTKANLLEIIKE